VYYILNSKILPFKKKKSVFDLVVALCPVLFALGYFSDSGSLFPGPGLGM
jgi:hypothetical protein